MNRCRHLRWKGARDDIREGRVAEVFTANHVTYSCLRTCNAWGPDDQLAVPEGCGADRLCFDPAEESLT